jgi:hypothetical protein
VISTFEEAEDQRLGGIFAGGAVALFPRGERRVAEVYFFLASFSR